MGRETIYLFSTRSKTVGNSLVTADNPHPTREFSQLSGRHPTEMYTFMADTVHRAAVSADSTLDVVLQHPLVQTSKNRFARRLERTRERGSPNHCKESDSIFFLTEYYHDVWKFDTQASTWSEVHASTKHACLHLGRLCWRPGDPIGGSASI